MVLPVNLDTGADLLQKLGSYRAAGAQAELSSANADRVVAETQDYVSQTQKDLRKAKAESEIAAANAEKMKSEITLEQPDLFRQVYESGMGAKLQQSLAEKGEAINDQITNAFGDKLESPDQYSNIYSNLLNTNPQLVKILGLPSMEQMMKDPSQLPRVKMLVGSAWSNKAEFARQRALQKEEITAKKDLQSSAQTFEAGESGKQRGFIAGQASLDRGFRAGEAAKEREFQAGESHLKLDWQSGENAMDRALKRDIAELDYQAALAKAKAAQKGKVPKVADVMGETTTNFKKYTAPSIVDRVLEERGIDLGDDLKNQLAFEASNQALGDWDRAVKKGETPDHPGIMVEKLVDYYISSGRIKKEEGIFSQGEIAEADAAMIKNVGGRNPDSLKRAKANYSELMKEPEFKRMNPMEKEDVLRRVQGQ